MVWLGELTGSMKDLPHTRHPSPETEPFGSWGLTPPFGEPEGGEASRAYAQVSTSTHAVVRVVMAITSLSSVKAPALPSGWHCMTLLFS